MRFSVFKGSIIHLQKWQKMLVNTKYFSEIFSCYLIVKKFQVDTYLMIWLCDGPCVQLPPPKRPQGEIRRKIQIQVCRHRLR